MSNKNIIEEKIKTWLRTSNPLCRYAISIEGSDLSTVFLEGQFDFTPLIDSLTDLLAHQQARNIEAVEKIAIILYDARKGPNEKPNIKHALDKEDVLAAIRPQQQEEV